MQHRTAGNAGGGGDFRSGDMGVAQVDKAADRRLQDFVPGHGAFLCLPTDFTAIFGSAVPGAIRFVPGHHASRFVVKA